MKVPLLDLHAHHAPIKDEIFKVFESVFQSQAYILGPEVAKLEASIAAYCGVDHAIGVSSGTDALLISLMSLGIGTGDEVITSTYTFFATGGAIARVGAKPVFVDIDPESYNIAPEKIGQAVTDKTKAIIPVHLYGQVADMEAISGISKKHGLKIIEDAAQAIGAEYQDGRRAGSFGDLGCFSFFPSKNLGALGDGGMVVTNDSALAERVRKMRVHGGHPKYYHKMIGGNFRLDSLQAGVVNVKLQYLDRWTARRRENAKRYVALFQKSGLIEKIALGLPKAVYAGTRCKHDHIYNQFVIRVPDRDTLREFLKKEEIGNEVYYPIPLHLQACFQNLGYKAGDCPEAERAAHETIALPIFPELTPEIQGVVVDAIKRFYGF
ncbi:MAG: DegT/DnrJ/EryC1/StrS family aminotransferase [Nitrospiria bacterium]